jgi:uncharacterized protein YrrD
MFGFTIEATDGAIGDVENLYFDDLKWVVRYLVVAAGGFLSGRRVLISPISVDKIDGDHKLIIVNLTMRQVENSPGPDNAQPISRRMEEIFNRYYHYPSYWIGSDLWGEDSRPRSIAEVLDRREIPPDVSYDSSEEMEGCCLRSAREVLGYTLHLDDDEELGRVHDLLLDERDWRLVYVIASSGGILKNQKQLYQPDSHTIVSWSDQRIYLSA